MSWLNDTIHRASRKMDKIFGTQTHDIIRYVNQIVGTVFAGYGGPWAVWGAGMTSSSINYEVARSRGASLKDARRGLYQGYAASTVTAGVLYGAGAFANAGASAGAGAVAPAGYSGTSAAADAARAAANASYAAGGGAQAAALAGESAAMTATQISSTAALTAANRGMEAGAAPSATGQEVLPATGGDATPPPVAEAGTAPAETPVVELNADGSKVDPKADDWWIEKQWNKLGPYGQSTVLGGAMTVGGGLLEGGGGDAESEEEAMAARQNANRLGRLNLSGGSRGSYSIPIRQVSPASQAELLAAKNRGGLLQ